MKKLLFLSLTFVLVACSQTKAPTADLMEGMDHSESEMSAQASLDRLNNSPRHQEWVEVDNNGKTIHTFVVYPETSGPAPVVLLIHENKGLNDWARSMADQVAEAGYIAVAPDLLSQYSSTIEQTSDFVSDDEATKAIGELDPAQVQSDLEAVAQWALTIPSSNGKLASAGFCWGGGQSFAFATTSDDLDAALVFYGPAPTDVTAFSNIEVPVFGFYGGADDRINAGIPAAESAMTAAGKTYDYKIYDGAGHAFMRSGEDPAGDPANVAARNAAWERMKQILSTL